MTKVDRAAISSLLKDENIVIKQADKGGAIVILNKTDYITEALHQLSDPFVYVPIASDPTRHIQSLIKIIL